MGEARACSCEGCPEARWLEDPNGLCLVHSPLNGKDDGTAKQVWARARAKAQERDADFRGWHFPVDSDKEGFRSVPFRGDASFAGARFEGGARFDDASFEGTADFTGARFEGDASFRGAEFQGGAQFGRVSVRGSAGFEGARFQGGTWFVDAAIEGDARFKGASFQGFAWFMRAGVRGSAWFDDASFAANAWFDRASFQGLAVFTGAGFHGGAQFDGAAFRSDARFEGASFQDEALFSGASFQGSARFERASFLCDARFERAGIQGNAWFEGASIHGDARFEGANIEGDASFADASIHGNARFEGVSFQGDGWFERASFRGKADYRGVQWREGKEIHFDLPSRPLPFGRRKPFSLPEHGETAYRLAKQSATARGDYTGAAEYYYAERCATEHWRRKQFGWKPWCPSFWRSLFELVFARWVFGYGQRPSRVLLLGLVVIVLWAFRAYGCAGITPGLAPEMGYEPTSAECLHFSVSTFMTLGYGDFVPKPQFRIWADAEAFLGASFLAVFIVGLTRKYAR